MDINRFYFINEQYYKDFPDTNLMKNKEVVNGEEHNRPCFYAIKDREYNIYWFIPFSSQVTKYEKVYNDKIAKYGQCDTIVFGHVLGKKKAFLIQNICPITDEYINNQYIDISTNNPVTISESLAKILEKKARKILTLQRKGKKLIFPDIFKIEDILLVKQEINEIKEEVAATKTSD